MRRSPRRAHPKRFPRPGLLSRSDTNMVATQKKYTDGNNRERRELESSGHFLCSSLCYPGHTHHHTPAAPVSIHMPPSSPVRQCFWSSSREEQSEVYRGQTTRPEGPRHEPNSVGKSGSQLSSGWLLPEFFLPPHVTFRLQGMKLARRIQDLCSCLIK